MKKVLFLTLVLILIVGCGAPKYICPDGTTVVDDKSKCPSAETEKEPETVLEPVKVEEKEGSVPAQPEEPKTTATKPAPEPATGMDKDIQKMIDNTDKLTSYTFTYMYGTQKVMKYTVVGDKIGVELMYGNPIYDKYGYYDRVLLDIREKTALIYCVERSACELDDKKVAKKVPYEEFAMPVDPIALVKSIGEDAKIIGEITCDDSRPCTRIKFKEDGQDVEMHLDNYYGFPYFWSKGSVEKTFTGFISMPRNPEVALPAAIEETIE